MSQAGHILLIDDDRGTRETLSDVLLLKGYAVETAGLGQEGLKKLRAHPFDAAIVDVKLPDISGLDLLRLIKEASPEIEVILITAFASLNSAIQAISGDSFAYLTKPFKMDHLLVTLENALEKRRLAIENRRLYQATMQELAERTRAEEELRESETTFRSLVESANDAIILSDGSGNIVSWNRAAQTIFGYGEKEVLGKPLTVLMPERYRDSHRKGLDRLRSTGLAHVLGKTIELHGLKKDGSEFPLEISLTTWKKGRRTFYSGIIRDITERKQAEEEIQRQRQRLAVLHEIELAITSSLDLRAVLDILIAKIDSLLPNFATEIWLFNIENRQLERIVCGNLDEKEWMRRKLLDTPPLLKATLKQKAPLFVSNVQTDPRILDPSFFRKHGLVSYLGVPLIDKGEALGVITFMTREEHQFSKEEREFLTTLAGQAAIAIHNSPLYEEIKKQAVELERSNRVKSEFLSVMSHELRTPLNIIMGSMGVIQDGMLGEVPEAQDKFLRKSMSSSRELLSMINSILVATRIEAEAVKAESCEFSVEKFLRELKAAYDVPLDKGLTVTWDYPSDLPVMETDPGKLKQILQNLINNAIKFTEKGSVTISARYFPGTQAVEFKVADTGIGIPKKAQPFIFDKFRQLDSSDSRQYGGMGLGLHIVKTFTEMLGGTLELVSEPRRGSTFRITVPIKLKANHNHGNQRPRLQGKGRNG